VATITGRTVNSTLPPCDTPGVATASPGSPDGLSRAAAEVAWHAVTASIAGTPHVRISKDGGRTYPARHARRLPDDPPDQPCAAPVFDPATGTGRMLAFDLDPGRVGRDVHDGAVHHDHELCADLAAEVERQAAELGQLLERLGARYVADVGPTGGRHVFVVFAAALPWLELRDLVRAIALRFAAVDPAPHASLGGQISPPGSRHKSGGWRVLSMPLEDARAAVECPNGPEVWDGLLAEFAAELQQAEVVNHGGTVVNAATGLGHVDNQSRAEVDDAGVPWIPRRGGRAPLGAELEQVARTGRWDRSHYAGRSEARMAIVGSAVARGWQLADVRAAVASGAWKGLAELYARRSEPGRMERLLPLEWRKCAAGISREKNVRHRHTSDLSTRPPADQSGVAAEYGLIREWLTAILCAAEDPERVKGWGGRAIAVRLVLLALGQAAMVSGSSVIEFGTRNLALHSCLSHRTVARVLRLLAGEDDPLIDLVSPRRMARADRWLLRIPDRYADSVRWRRRRGGRIEAAHPVFLVLGGTSALVYQVLDQAEARGADVARAARLSASATSAALRVLAEQGLAERGPGGWRRGPVALAAVAESIGAAHLQREREARYKLDRESWRARLRAYQGARQLRTSARDGWWSLDDGDEYDEMCRWPVLSDDFVRGPPSAAARESA
jgi:hypothetical protein